MKKKFLGFLIAGLVLASNATILGNQLLGRNNNQNYFKECQDDEDFYADPQNMVIGHKSYATSKSTYTGKTTPVEGWIEPSIGVQYSTDGTKCAIRFIAAIRLMDTNDNGFEDELEAIDLNWVREVYAPDGSVVKSGAYKPSTQLYKAYNNGGVRYTINKYNQDHGTEYTHFVTYVMKNVPIATHGNDYILAYLQPNLEAPSKVFASTLAQGTAFTYEQSLTGYFAVSKVGEGNCQTYKGLLQNVENSNLITKFELPAVESTQNYKFLVCNKTNTSFKVYGYDNSYSANSEIAGSKVGDSQFTSFSTADMTGHFGIYFANDYTFEIREDDTVVRHYSLNDSSDQSVTGMFKTGYLKYTFVDKDDNTQTYYYYTTSNSTGYQVDAVAPKGYKSLTVAYVKELPVGTSTGYSTVHHELTGQDYTTAHLEYYQDMINLNIYYRWVLDGTPIE